MKAAMTLDGAKNGPRLSRSRLKSLIIGFSNGFAAGAVLVKEKIFGYVILVNTVNFRGAFQLTRKAKGIHPLLTIAHLIGFDQSSLFQD